MDSGILSTIIVFVFVVCIIGIIAMVTTYGSSEQSNLTYGSSKQSNANNAIITAGQSLRIGMGKDEVIGMLGPNYTKSVLASGEEKYEWKVRNGGYSVGYKGTGVRSYVPQKTRRLSVYFKDDRVSRYSGLNLD